MPAKEEGSAETLMRVIVVGGGVIGLTLGWRLAASGHRVDLFDDSPAEGASWAAAGMLSPGGEAWFGETPQLQLGLASLDLWPRFAAELGEASGHDVWLATAGTLLFGVDEADAADLERVAGLLVAHDVEAVPVTRRELRRLEPAAGSVRRAIQVPGDLSVHNRRLLAALRIAGERAGARFHAERADVVVEDECRATGVRGRHTDVVTTADATVLAAGHELGRVQGLPSYLAGAVRPVKGQILRLQGPSGLLRHTVRALVRGNRVYAVPRADGEIVIGATQEERDDHVVVTVDGVHGLLDDSLSVLPALRECAVQEVLARARPGTADNGPLIGSTGVHGLLVAGGHHRGGVLLAPITATAIAALIDGRPPPAEVTPFTPDRIAGLPIDSKVDRQTETLSPAETSTVESGCNGRLSTNDGRRNR